MCACVGTITCCKQAWRAEVARKCKCVLLRSAHTTIAACRDPGVQPFILVQGAAAIKVMPRHACYDWIGRPSPNLNGRWKRHWISQDYERCSYQIRRIISRKNHLRLHTLGIRSPQFYSYTIWSVV